MIDLSQGTYTTSPHVMARTKVGERFPTLPHAPPSASPPSTRISGALSILASYDGPFDDVFFTVNVFCGTDIKVWWDEDAGTGDSISPKGGRFSVKVHLDVDATLCLQILTSLIGRRRTHHQKCWRESYAPDVHAEPAMASSYL